MGRMDEIRSERYISRWQTPVRIGQSGTVFAGTRRV